MIVEFIGCSGAGKTTLLRMLHGRRIAGRRVLAMPDLVVGRPLLRRISHPTAVNVVQEVGGLPSFVGAWSDECDFVRFARRLLGRAPSTFYELNGLRGVVRKVGMYHLAARRAADEIVLSDEGTLLTAYDLFVTTGVDFGRLEIEEFVALVPLPDVVVHVRAPVGALVERAMSRPDTRRQHAGKDRARIEDDVRRTVTLFDLLASTEPLPGRVFVVENGHGDETRRRDLADQIAEHITSFLPTFPTASTASSLGEPVVPGSPPIGRPLETMARR